MAHSNPSVILYDLEPKDEEKHYGLIIVEPGAAGPAWDPRSLQLERCRPCVPGWLTLSLHGSPHFRTQRASKAYRGLGKSCFVLKASLLRVLCMGPCL